MTELYPIIVSQTILKHRVGVLERTLEPTMQAMITNSNEYYYVNDGEETQDYIQAAPQKAYSND